MLPNNDWVWMPHPAHLMIADCCRFHLATCVGNGQFVVSTVGEYWPESEVREILATSRGIELQGRGDARRADYMQKLGYEDLGLDRKYETMVFHAHRTDRTCCPFAPIDFCEIDFDGYNDPGDALKGHMHYCQIWGGEQDEK